MKDVDYSLPRRKILKNKLEVTDVFVNGQTFTNYPLKIFLLPSSQDGISFSYKVGFAAPKKKYRHAFQRNRVKRLLREAFRLEQNLISHHFGIHLVVLAISSGELSLDKVRASMRELLEQIGQSEF